MLKFYTRPDCHLCDLAWDVLIQAGINSEVTMVNIEDDIDLLHRYGLRIPVIRDSELDREIGWPFSQNDLLKTFGENPAVGRACQELGAS